MKKSQILILLLAVVAMVASGCCRKCDSEFSESENALMIYEPGQVLTYGSDQGDTIQFKVDDISEKLDGRKCNSMFGGDDLCMIYREARITAVSGEFESIIATLRKVDGIPDLELIMPGGFVLVQSPVQNPDYHRIIEPTSLTLNGVTYNDVYQRDFDPHEACKYPEDCVEEGDVLVMKYSLTEGLLQFEAFRGLQQENEVYTLVRDRGIIRR